MAAEVHYFGIRHHGPGSARRLVEALDRLAPACVLIEAPADAALLLPILADPAMVPPVALLVDVSDAPASAAFYPFATFSPEYQAVCWAVRHGATLDAIDLPSTLRVAATAATAAEAATDTDDGSTDDAQDAPETPDPPAPAALADIPAADDLDRDPIGALARAAGYEDGESWWHDWVEGGSDAGTALAMFASVADAMTELRRDHDALAPLEAKREAHMRLAISAAARQTDGPVAVVCGAWHVPALVQRHKAAADRALLAHLPRARTRLTWVPWTYPRLAANSGYGAGVLAPRWYAHLWQHGPGGAAMERWLVDVARAFRETGEPVSTASVIETVRMASALASLRGRPSPGFEEARDAVVACLCHGERLAWQQHEARLLLGSDVGEIPPDTPLMPLLEDLQRQQKLARLKPEALPRELALDLRMESGLLRSTLLHRLTLLDVPWGRAADAGGSRGTFRERWTLAWEPEFAVSLVEHLVHGTTIEQAASRRSGERLLREPGLAAIAQLTQACLEAQLPQAVDVGLGLVAERAAHAQDCGELLETLPALIDLRRYGSARDIALGQLDGLVERLVAQASLALPYAVRGLDGDESDAMGRRIARMHVALGIADLEASERELWWQALEHVLADPQASRRIVGLAGRLLYDEGRIATAGLLALMQRMLSPGTPTPEAAQFFEGFFADAARRLLHDDGLLAAIDGWLSALDGDTFQQQLPLFRRVFSTLDMIERRRLLDRAVSPAGGSGGIDRDIAIDVLPDWHIHEQRLLALFDGAPIAWPE